MTERKRTTLLDRSVTTRELIFILFVVLCMSPYINPPLGLFLGLVVAQLIGHPYLHLNHKATHILLQISVVGLGFGMNVETALNAGKDGIVFTVVSIFGTLFLGLLLGVFLKIKKKTSYLISTGTAICGGSAIAAISPVIKADEKEISVALGTIFILNSLALFIFPYVGGELALSQNQFGVWCAIAIHDTSSVVGAASRYGTEALDVATTVKLARALWIIPIAFASTYIFKNRNSKVNIPYFIGIFIIAMILNSYVPIVTEYGGDIANLAKHGLTLTLFLIGCGLNRSRLIEVGVKPLIQGVILWIIISAASLYAIMSFLK